MTQAGEKLPSDIFRGCHVYLDGTWHLVTSTDRTPMKSIVITFNGTRMPLVIEPGRQVPVKTPAEWLAYMDVEVRAVRQAAAHLG